MLIIFQNYSAIFKNFLEKFADFNNKMAFMAEKDILYKKIIIRELYFANMISCPDLSERIHKSLPLTAKILNELIEEGYVVETGYAPSTGGRRPIMYSLRSDMMYIVSVAMDQFITRIAILDMQNNYITEIEKFELQLSRQSEQIDLLANKIDEFISKSGINKNKIIGVGIGMPGFVNARKGLNYSFLDSDGKSIADYITKIINLPVFIDNDSRLIALAELKFGAAQNSESAMVINIGWGIGLGLIINAELFKGRSGFAGEFSHLPLFSNGKLCRCGKNGCLETEASMAVVTEKAMEGLKAGRVSVLKEQLTQENIEEDCKAIMGAARNGDQFAVELLSDAGYHIGRGIAILIHLVNPELIILSGRGSLAGQLWLAPIQQALNEHCIPMLASNTEIEISTLGYNAELIGAVALVMENYEQQLTKKASLVMAPVNGRG